MRGRLLSDARGFFLLEALIAAAILASALLALAQIIALATSATSAAGRMTDAALLAAQKVEQLRAGSWSELQRAPIRLPLDLPGRGPLRRWLLIRITSRSWKCSSGCPEGRRAWSR